VAVAGVAAVLAVVATAAAVEVVVMAAAAAVATTGVTTVVATAVAVVMQEEVPLAAPIGVPGPAAGKTAAMEPVLPLQATASMQGAPVAAAVAAIPRVVTITAARKARRLIPA
jgi:hypothetical protein